MHIALFGRSVSHSGIKSLTGLFNFCTSHNIRVSVYQSLYEFLTSIHITFPSNTRIFKKGSEIGDIDFIFSIGGDGTFLRAARLVGDLKIPIVGINTGRLGFLADRKMDEITGVMNEILNHEHLVEERSLIKINTGCAETDFCNYALNDISVLRRDTSSLIVVHVYDHNKLLNSFWADGLIIATPTGSTAYSMSAGGPIVVPSSNSFILTPIAPHSLTVRPIVIPDSAKLRLEIESRSDSFMLSVDSKSKAMSTSTIIHMEKGEYPIRVVQHKSYDFYETLRKKLMWGVDIRTSNR